MSHALCVNPGGMLLFKATTVRIHLLHLPFPFYFVSLWLCGFDFDLRGNPVNNPPSPEAIFSITRLQLSSAVKTPHLITT